MSEILSYAWKLNIEFDAAVFENYSPLKLSSQILVKFYPKN